MKVYVGTSGWFYDWNIDGTLDWYVKNSKLNAIELNASFYRFPFPNQIYSWAKKGIGLRWSIKVNKLITHVKRLKEDSLKIWNKFKKLFDPMESYIDFYLFQMPPNFIMNNENIKRLKFYTKELESKFAIEFRHESWFNENTVRLCEELGIILVSIDAPIGTWINKSNKIIYLRMHGRVNWYFYNYEEKELKKLAKEILKLNPEKTYVFFNNNHWMLENAKTMFNILQFNRNML
ncbi:MAG: DUF72 domain-containing protein [Candidatus Methanomethylicaceae archaeon]